MRAEIGGVACRFQVRERVRQAWDIKNPLQPLLAADQAWGKHLQRHPEESITAFYRF